METTNRAVLSKPRRRLLFTPNTAVLLHCTHLCFWYLDIVSERHNNGSVSTQLTSPLTSTVVAAAPLTFVPAVTRPIKLSDKSAFTIASPDV